MSYINFNLIMFLIVHAAVGATIGDNVNSPIVGASAGLMSHFVMDAIPHGDELIGRMFKGKKLKRWLVILALLDGLAALAMVATLWLGGFFNNAVGAFGGAVGALLPDALVGLSELSKKKIWPEIVRFHDWAHQILNTEVPFYVGGFIQTIFFLAVLRFLGLDIF